MLTHSSDADLERFLAELAQAVCDQTDGQVSMYTIGEKIGLGRDAASRTAEELMAQGWVEVRTLSGDIGLTEAGLEKLAQSAPGEAEAPAALASRPVLDEVQTAHLEALMAEIKVTLANSGLDFDALAEAVADLRTLDAQMASPRPKTAVLRATLKEISESLAGTLAPPLAARIRTLLG